MAGLPGLTGMTANSLVSVRELRDLNEALKANGGSLAKANVGYPGSGVDRDVGFSGDIAPLVPQSIQNTLDSATFTMEHIVFWKNIPKVPVQSTIHESNVIKEHGAMDMDPFIAEGAGGTVSEASYERKIVKIKYLAEKIELSDVATMVGITGVDKSALAQRTLDGTQALIGKVERNLFHADSSLNDLHFDGLFKQLTSQSVAINGASGAGKRTISASQNYLNNEGAATSPQQLQDILGELLGGPNYAYPNMIMCEPRVYQSLVNIATSFGRHDQLQSPGGRGITFGAKDLSISGPTGPVKVVPCPFLQFPELPNSAAQGATFTAPSAPAVSAGSDSDSLFKAADAGFYKYKVVAVSKTGVAAPATTSHIEVASGEAVTLTVNDGTDGGGSNLQDSAGTSDTAVKYYRVYRSAVAATSGAVDTDTCKFIGQWPANSNGTADTVIVDLNRKKPGSSEVYVMQMDPTVMYWAQLLDFTRRPLAQVNTTIPFLLMMFGSLHVKVPSKCFVIDNVGFNL